MSVAEIPPDLLKALEKLYFAKRRRKQHEKTDSDYAIMYHGLDARQGYFQREMEVLLAEMAPAIEEFAKIGINISASPADVGYWEYGLNVKASANQRQMELFFGALGTQIQCRVCLDGEQVHLSEGQLPKEAGNFGRLARYALHEIISHIESFILRVAENESGLETPPTPCP